MRTAIRYVVIFLAITGAVALLGPGGQTVLGQGNYWDHHGLLFLIFVTVFPRLTLLFSSIPLGGLLWWLGFIFAPRILVALLATAAYWVQNPILVVIAWLVAVSGESSEKYVIVNRAPRWSGVWQKGEPKDVEAEIVETRKPKPSHELE